MKDGLRKQMTWRKRKAEYAVYYLPYCKACARAVRAKASRGHVGIEIPRGLYREITGYAKQTGQTTKAAVAVLLRDGLGLRSGAELAKGIETHALDPVGLKRLDDPARGLDRDRVLRHLQERRQG